MKEFEKLENECEYRVVLSWKNGTTLTRTLVTKPEALMWMARTKQICREHHFDEPTEKIEKVL